MRVLMVTPAVYAEDPIHGFILTWVNTLAQRVGKLYVVTLRYDPASQLQSNVTVYSLERSASTFGRFIELSRIMLKLLRRDADLMFCHMNPGVSLCSAVYARLFGIPVVAWRAHKSLGLKVRLLHFLSARIVTSSEEGFRLKSNKVIITGQGIDTERFKPTASPERKDNKRRILSVGRISPIKDHETLIEAANVLVNEKGRKDLEFIIVGGADLPSHKEHYQQIGNMVEKLELGDYVKLVGPVPHSQVVDYYNECDLFVTASQTGSMDKVVLEAMACGKPVLVCNEAFAEVFISYSEVLMFNKKDPADLAQKITGILQMDRDSYGKLCSSLREMVKKGHNVDSLMDKLVDVFTSVGKK